MARYHGSTGRVYLAPNGTDAAVPVASLDSWDIDMTSENVETTSFGDGNRTYVKGYPDAKGNFSGFWDDDEDTFWSAVSSTAAVRVYLYPSTNAITKYWYGTAFVSAKLSASAKEAVKTSASWVGASTWTKI